MKRKMLHILNMILILTLLSGCNGKEEQPVIEDLIVEESAVPEIEFKEPEKTIDDVNISVVGSDPFMIIYNSPKQIVEDEIEIEDPDETEEIEETDEIAEEPVFLEEIPVYDGEPYTIVNGNVPFFDKTLLDDAADSYETYSELDELGRCGAAIANIGQDLMPTEERGSIGQVKPTGWHTIKYNDLIDGNYLYNRCHLIGYQLTAENANPQNLITGTRYLNVVGMLPFENLVADYVKNTDEHVLYRVTPVFMDKELVARGVLIEAYSVENDGEGIMFNVFCHNVQPGIVIDYETGDSSREDGGDITEQEYEEEFDTDIDIDIDEYAVNDKNGKIHITGECPATGDGEKAMTDPVYFNTYDEAEEYSVKIAPDLEKRQCGNCWR